MAHRVRTFSTVHVWNFSFLHTALVVLFNLGFPGLQERTLCYASLCCENSQLFLVCSNMETSVFWVHKSTHVSFLIELELLCCANSKLKVISWGKRGFGLLCEEHSAAEPWATGPQEANTTQECQVGPGLEEASRLQGENVTSSRHSRSVGEGPESPESSL